MHSAHPIVSTGMEKTFRALSFIKKKKVSDLEYQCLKSPYYFGSLVYTFVY